MDTHLSICFPCLWSCFVFRFVLTWVKVLDAEQKMENVPPEFGRVAHYLVQVRQPAVQLSGLQLKSWRRNALWVGPLSPENRGLP